MISAQPFHQRPGPEQPRTRSVTDFGRMPETFRSDLRCCDEERLYPSVANDRFEIAHRPDDPEAVHRFPFSRAVVVDESHRAKTEGSVTVEIVDRRASPSPCAVQKRWSAVKTRLSLETQ